MESETYSMYDTCSVCDHEYGAHYTTNDGTWRGCADCAGIGCEGFIVFEAEDA